MNLYLNGLLLLSVFISGCVVKEVDLVDSAPIDYLTGEWVREGSRENSFHSITFKSDLKCRRYQKNGHEGLIVFCRYEKEGKRVVVYHINRGLDEDTGFVQEYEYDKSNEKLYIYRDPEDEERDLVFLKNEN